MTIKIYDSMQELAENYAAFFHTATTNILTQKQTVNVSLSGGSTPKLFFDVLAKAYHDKIKWEYIHFFWGDERCVAPTDNESNYKMTKEALFNHIDIPDSNIHRIKGEQEPTIEAQRYADEIANHLTKKNNLPQFDITILGVGDDGHTASIFADQINLINSNNICEVATHPISKQKRITVSGKIINNSDCITFLIGGANKAEVIKTIINKETDYLKYPTAHIIPASNQLYFFMDAAAAKLLND